MSSDMAFNKIAKMQLDPYLTAQKLKESMYLDSELKDSNVS
jgi:hypothetical protein